MLRLEPVFQGTAAGVPPRLIKLIRADCDLAFNEFKKRLMQVFRFLPHVYNVAQV